MAWLGTLITIITYAARIGGIFAALAAVLNGQQTVVNAHAVGSYDLPSILTTAYTALAALGLSSTWLVPLKKIADGLKQFQSIEQVIKPAPAPQPGPQPDQNGSGGGISSILSALSLPNVLSLLEAGTTWFSKSLADQPLELKGNVGGFVVDLTIKPADSAATLPQADQAAEIARRVIEILRPDSVTVSGARVNPGLAMPAAG